ncbi:MAG: photosynthesis system II assembly factor Ycf48 [Pseudanabaena sp. ELA607]
MSKTSPTTGHKNGKPRHHLIFQPTAIMDFWSNISPYLVKVWHSLSQFRPLQAAHPTRSGAIELKSLVMALGLALCLTCSTLGASPAYADGGSWHQVSLPTNTIPLDLTFVKENPNRGWLAGTDATLLRTDNGGQTWQQIKLDLGDGIYRFVSVSFSGDEGWVVGKPALLLHTANGGQSWTRIGLNSKLPGDPEMITALGVNTAEMTTDLGAIYQTDDQGQNWKALVTQAVGAVRNLNRSESGAYIAVSNKGNFYSTWFPGETAWSQHNRNSSRRVQNMGFGKDGRVWMLNRGGQLQFSEVGNLGSWEKAQAPRAASGFGLLDLAYQDEQNIWVSGGSSRLLHSNDGGKSWHRDESVKNVGANLYRIYFFDHDHGFIIGQNGTLLAYSPED